MIPLPPHNFDMPRLSTMTLGGALLLALFVATSAWAISPNSTDAKAIMAAVDKQPDGDKRVSTLTMKVKDSAGRERTRQVKSWSIEFKGGTKQLMIFSGPADVRNTGLLSVDYDDGSKTDDQWLYLPSLRKSTRIASSDKSGSFMGTDLSYSDMTKSDISHYDYSIVTQSVTVSGEECWKIESRPRTEKTKKETGYVKSWVWISKKKLVVLQVQNWIREGRKLKQIRFGDYKQLSGIWIPHKISARTLRGGKTESTTLLKFTNLKLNDPSVVGSMFNQRRLEQGL